MVRSYQLIQKEEKIDFLQLLGFAVLSVFFYLYTVGKAYGREDTYLSWFLAATLIAAIMLIRDFSRIKQYKQYFIWQFVFITFIVFSTLYTANPNPEPYVGQMFKLLLKTTTVVIICRNFEGVKKLMICFSVVGVAVFLFLFSTGALFIIGRLGEDLTGNANTFGLLATMFFVGSMNSFMKSSNKLLKALFALSILIDLFLIILSGGRKFLLFAAVLIATTFFMRRKISIMNLILTVLVMSVIVYFVGSLIMNNEILYEAIGYRFDGLTGGEAEGVDDQSGIMKKGLELFWEKPLFGWGIQSFQVVGGYGFYAHSNYVELLADYGIIGTAIYYSQLLFCWFCMWRRRKSINKSEEFLLYFPLLTSIFVLDIFAISFNQTAFIPLLVMLISGYCYRLTHRGQIV